MNTTQQKLMVDNADSVLAPEMTNLLTMTNEILMKIKQQSRGMLFWTLVRFVKTLSMWVIKDTVQLIAICMFYK